MTAYKTQFGELIECELQSEAYKKTSAKQQAWNNKFTDALTKIAGHQTSLDWSIPTHYFYQKVSPDEAARKYAAHHLNIHVGAAPVSVLDKRIVALIKKTVKEVKEMNMDLNSAIQIAIFQVKQTGSILLKPGAKEELEQLVKSLF